MSVEMTIRAWKDEEYRQSLSPEERAQLEESPAGFMQVTDAEMAATDGGWTFVIPVSLRVCGPIVKYTVSSCPRTIPLLCRRK